MVEQGGDPSAATERLKAPHPVLAVVGCGRMGSRFHVPTLAARRDAELRVLVDARREETERLAAQYGIERVLTSVDGLAAAGVTAAVVAVPNHLHAPVAIDLLEQGIDVLVEKPLAPSVADCERMRDAARRAGRVLAVDLPLRFSRPARLARDLIASGALGRIDEVEVEFGTAYARPTVTDRRRQRETGGGGVLIERGSHILDLLVWWLGDLTVTGYHDDAHGGVEADCVVELALPDGGTAGVELSWTRDLGQVAVIRGELGTLEVGLGRNHVAWQAAGASDDVLRGRAEPAAARRAPGETLAEQIRAVHDDFLAAMDGRGEPAAPAAEATRSVRLIEACYGRREQLVAPWAIHVPAASPPTFPAGLRGLRVLVTGATGFIGGRVVEQLVADHGAEVRALARPSSTVARLLRFPVDLRWGSITDEDAVADAVAGCDIVIHCAHDTGSPLRNLRSGVQGTETLVAAAARAGAQRFVHLSSVVVYGETADGDLWEGSPWGRSRDPYTLAKRRGEGIVEAAHERGLPSVILQPTKVYGPWGKRWTTVCVQQMRTGAVPVVDGGRGLCNVVYVDDVVAAILLAARAAAAVGERFLVSAREPVTWRDFYGGFEAALGRRATVSVPAEALGPLARAERRRLRRAFLRLAAGGLRGATADPDARAALRSLPAARMAMVLAEGLLGAERWGELKAGVLNRSAASAGGDARPRLHVPGANVVASQRSRTRVRIDHAERVLGYEPRYDLDRGMAATAEFLRWARLLGDGVR